MGADLEHRADPVRRGADRARRRGDPRGRGHVAPAAVGPAARRRRGRPRGHPDGDDLRAEPARPLAHEARGHEARAPRAVGARARPAGVEDDRVAELTQQRPGSLSTPIPSTSTSTTSPGCERHLRVARPADARRRAREDQVARLEREHVRDVRDEERHAGRSGRSSSRPAAPRRSGAGRRAGRCRRRAPTPGRARSPSGQNVSKPLARVHWLSAYWMLRAERSFAQR